MTTIVPPTTIIYYIIPPLLPLYLLLLLYIFYTPMNGIFRVGIKWYISLTLIAFTGEVI